MQRVFLAAASLSGALAEDQCGASDVLASKGTSGGTLLEAFVLADAGACCAECADAAQCVAWTFRTSTSQCRLKAGAVKFEDEDDDHVSGHSTTPTKPSAPKGRPNFVLLLTDDQDVLLDSMEAHEGALAMPAVNAKLRQGGATMRQYAAHTPVCCPSRSELLSGRYFHNIRSSVPDTKVASNDCMHVNATLNDFESHTVGSYLWRAGYSTAMIGKYLNDGGMNGICPTKKKSDGLVPFGWDRFFAMCPDTCYVDCVFSDQGTWVKRNDTSAPGSNYATSVMGNVSVAWLEQQFKEEPHRPFFLKMAPHAPHGPFTPAAWYDGEVWTEKTVAPRTASYGVHGKDHNWMVSSQPKISDKEQAKWDANYRDRLRTLLSVDDAFAGIHKVLEKQGRADNTYFLYTSDHGFHIGQFRMSPCKRTVYETDTRVPFYIAGPGVAAGFVADDFVGHSDIAPTVLALAGVDIPERMDGRSFAHLVAPGLASNNNYRRRDTWLVEYYATTSDVKLAGKHAKDAVNNTFIALRMNSSKPVFQEVGDGQLLYAEFTDLEDWGHFEQKGPGAFFELYDLLADPSQLTNLYSGASLALKDALHARLRSEWGCRGTSGPNACDAQPSSAGLLFT